MPPMYSFDAMTDSELKRVREKYPLDHDDEQGTYTLVSASQCYRGLPGSVWPASWGARKDRPALHRLVIAGALLKAAIEVCELRTSKNQGLTYSMRATHLRTQYEQTKAEFETQSARLGPSGSSEQLWLIFERRDREVSVHMSSSIQAETTDGSSIQGTGTEAIERDSVSDVEMVTEAAPGDTVTAAASRALAVRKQHRGESGVDVSLKFNDTVIPVFSRDSVHDIIVRWKKRREFDQGQPKPTFESELTNLLNRYSCENSSDTPDFILARFLLASLEAFDTATTRRTQWYTSDVDLEDEQ